MRLQEMQARLWVQRLVSCRAKGYLDTLLSRARDKARAFEKRNMYMRLHFVLLAKKVM